MRQRQIQLQEVELVGGDVGVRQPPEPRVDAVGRQPLRSDVFHRFRAGIDGCVTRRVQFQLDAFPRNTAQLGQCQFAGGELDHRSSFLGFGYILSIQENSLESRTTKSVYTRGFFVSGWRKVLEAICDGLTRETQTPFRQSSLRVSCIWVNPYLSVSR